MWLDTAINFTQLPTGYPIVQGQTYDHRFPEKSALPGLSFLNG